jgi:hypothetical protein
MRGFAVVVAVLTATSGCGPAPGAEWPEERPQARELPAVCPQGTRWDGQHCVWQHVLVDVRCPQGSAWDGKVCRGRRDCGKYHHWDGSGCTATVAHRTAGGPAPAEAVSPWESEPDQEAEAESAEPVPDSGMHDLKLPGKRPRPDAIFDNR